MYVCMYMYMYTHIYIYIDMYIHIYIYIYICAHAPSAPPPLIHPNLLFVSRGSWEVGSLGCENIGRLEFPKSPTI